MSSPQNKGNLPPKRTGKVAQNADLPLSNTRLSSVIYFLVIALSALTAFYGYRTVQYKSEVGGWWNLAIHGKSYRPPSSNDHPHSKHESVETRIIALAESLGMPSKDLSKAIADAVRAYVPPASLSSIRASETGFLVDQLAGEGAGSEAGNAPADQATPTPGFMDSLVGMDEP